MTPKIPKVILPWLAVLLVSLVWLFERGLGALVIVIPLLVILPSLWLNHRTGIIVTIMLSILYVVIGIMEAFANPEQRSMGLLFTVASGWFFMALLSAAKRAPTNNPTS